jgi:3-dehydroquinate synthase
MKAGLAEVVKHYLIADADAIEKMSQLYQTEMMDLVKEAISIKTKFVEADPLESSIRKALNFGHTVGHAIESYYLHSETALLHGEAVVVGMICESYISQQLNLISEEELRKISEQLFSIFLPVAIDSKAFESITALLKKDKKNTSTQTRFSLLKGIGDYKIDVEIVDELIKKSLEYFNSLCK